MLLITVTTTQSQSLRQTEVTTIKPSFCLAATPLLMTFFYSVETLTKYSFTLNASVKIFSVIVSDSDSTNVIFSKLESNMLTMISPNQGTSPPSELLRMYSITPPQTHIHSTLQSHAMDYLLDFLPPFILPWTMALQFHNQYAQTKAILDVITHSKGS